MRRLDQCRLLDAPISPLAALVAGWQANAEMDRSKDLQALLLTAPTLSDDEFQLTHDFQLLTLNRKHFERVSSLKLFADQSAQKP